MNEGLANLESIVAKKRDVKTRQQRWRRLAMPHDCRLDLSHNDYLGLNQDVSFRESVLAKLKTLPHGAGASRLLSVSSPIIASVEKELARFKAAETALVFSSGFCANLSLLQALNLPGVELFCDESNHASIWGGVRYGAWDAQRVHSFRHADLEHLRSLLSRSTAKVNLIYTEALFSMDGDLIDTQAMSEIAKTYRGVLAVDEAHSIGIYGKDGAGAMNADDIDPRSLISINPCGKAIGGQGAFIAGPEWLRDWMTNKSKPFMYSTGISPWSAAWISEVVALLPKLESRRQRLRDNADALRKQLRELDFDTGPSDSHIIPVIVGDDSRARWLSDELGRDGIRTLPIRPPTVPVGRSRVRLGLNSGLDSSDIESIVDSFRRIRRDS